MSLANIMPLLVLGLLESFSYGIISPILPIATTNACLSGSKKADWWLSISNSAGSVISIMLIPWLGGLSDVYGRKPFLVISQLLRLGIPLSVIYLTESHGSIFPYLGAIIVDQMTATGSISSAAVADVIRRENRVEAFGLLQAVIIGGYCTSAGLSSILSTKECLRISTVLYIIRVPWALFGLKETLSTQIQQKLQTKLPRDKFSCVNPIDNMAILVRSRLFVLLTSLIAITTLSGSGVRSIIMFYFNSALGFNQGDTARYLLVVGIGSFLSQALFLKPLMNCGRETGVLKVALTAKCIEAGLDILTAYFPRKSIVFVGSIPGSIGALSFAAISSLKSVNCSDEEQGRLQGAIYGARAFFMALGPLIFAYFYSLAEKNSPLSKVIPFIVSIAIYCFGIHLVSILPLRAPNACLDNENNTMEYSKHHPLKDNSYLGFEDDDSTFSTKFESDSEIISNRTMGLLDDDESALSEPLLCTSNKVIV